MEIGTTHIDSTWILLRIHMSMRGLCDSYVIGNSLIMFPAVDKYLTQQIRYFCLISFDYISLFIWLCVRDVVLNYVVIRANM